MGVNADVNANVNANSNASAGVRLSALKHFCCLGDFNNAALHRCWAERSISLNAPTSWPQVRHGQIDN